MKQKGLAVDASAKLRLAKAVAAAKQRAALHLRELAQGATPDIITLLEAETGAPVTADALRYGIRVVAIAWPCDPQWRTPAGIALVGPRYFGYAMEYRPLDGSA